MTAQETLKKYFGYSSFRPGQDKLIDALVSGRDVLGVMPTGAGKSLCYQVPGLMRPGVTLVISPLIALMADQVMALKAMGIPAAYLNSTLSASQMALALQRAAAGAYRFIYVAPERLEAPSFLRFAMEAPISLLAVDEAHCVSQWGQDFRPVYLRIADFVAQLPKRPPIGAFTATATQRVREDIVRLLDLRLPFSVTTGFDRPNLFFEVDRPKDRTAAVVQIIRQKAGQAGIVYCATRKGVEQLWQQLNRQGISASRYHAGMADEDRKASQEDFQYDRTQVMVATNAFGMGIDKSNVRYVIHANMPKSMEAYYQEAGRAGRDGAPAECILLYNGSDIFTAKWMITHSDPNASLTAAQQAAVRQQDLLRLNQMIDYCTKNNCLRAFILRYFSQESPGHCDGCSVCRGARYGAEAPRVRVQSARKGVSANTMPSASKKSSPVAGDLFEQLRAVRLALAKQHHVPPYVICTDATLNDMIRRRPVTKEGLLSVSGMGETKVRRYGDAFLSVLSGYETQRRARQAAIREIAAQAQSTAAREEAAHPFSPCTWTASTQSTVAVQRAQPSHPPLENDDESLADAYLSGIPIQEIAEELNLLPEEVRERLRDMDLIF